MSVLEPIHSGVADFAETRRTFADLWRKIDKVFQNMGALTLDTRVDALEAIQANYGQITKLTTVNVNPVTNTPVKLTIFDAEGPTGGTVTSSHSNDRITCAAAGKYLVALSFVLNNSDVSDIYTLEVYVNGSASGFGVPIYCPSGSTSVGGAITFLISLTAGQYMEVFANHATAATNRNVDVRRLVLTARRIDD